MLLKPVKAYYGFYLGFYDIGFAERNDEWFACVSPTADRNDA